MRRNRDHSKKGGRGGCLFAFVPPLSLSAPLPIGANPRPRPARAPGGAGGPNLEYLTGLMAALPPGAPVAALAGDSDGIDGSADNAGGFFDAASRPAPDQCEAALQVNRTYALFGQIGGLIITGPTRTNVNDIRMIAVGDKR